MKIEPPEALRCFGSRLKKFSIQQKSRVYFLVYKGEVIYVGKTTHLVKRLWHHFRDKKFDGVYYIDVWPSDVTAVEATLICRINPPLNLSPPVRNTSFGPMRYSPLVDGDIVSKYCGKPRKKHEYRPEVTAEDCRGALELLCTPNARWTP